MQIYNVGFRPSTGVPLITLFTNAAGSSTTSTGRSLLIFEIDITASTTSIPQNVDQLTGTGGTAAPLSPAAHGTFQIQFPTAGTGSSIIQIA